MLLVRATDDRRTERLATHRLYVSAIKAVSERVYRGMFSTHGTARHTQSTQKTTISIRTSGRHRKLTELRRRVARLPTSLGYYPCAYPERQRSYGSNANRPRSSLDNSDNNVVSNRNRFVCLACNYQHPCLHLGSDLRDTSPATRILTLGHLSGWHVT